MKVEIQESLMRRYLFGELPEREADALEAELLADDEQFELAREIEDRLVDGYARDALADDEREKFERRYLISPARRERVAFAKMLVARADKSSSAAAPVAEPQNPRRLRLTEKLMMPVMSWQFASIAAALLLAVVAGLWLLFDRARLRGELAEIRAESEARQSREKALADQLAAAQGQSEKLTDELEQLRAGTSAAATPQPAASPPPPPVAPRSVFVFLLSPALVRSEGGGQQTLTIPPKTDAVRLQMNAGREEGARRFRVGVRTVEGRGIWEQTTVRSNRAVVSVDVPAVRLTPGDYVVTLSSVNQTGGAEEVNRYFLRVARR